MNYSLCTIPRTFLVHILPHTVCNRITFRAQLTTHIHQRFFKYGVWKSEGAVPLTFNPLNAELNPICHLLALLGAHHIFHVSGLRVNFNIRWK